MTSDEILLYDTQTGEKSGSIEIGYYPGGEPLITDMQISGTYNAMVLRPKSIGTFMAAMFLVDTFDRRGIPTPVLVLPYLPGARQDRLNEGPGDVLFTAHSVAREINGRHFPAVICFDPHSDVMPALIDRCYIATAASLFGRWAIDNPAGGDLPPSYMHCIGDVPIHCWTSVIAPDGGAEKRAAAVARQLQIPLHHAWKIRDVATGAITGTGIERIPAPELVGRHLVVDDICDGGRTFTSLHDIANLDLDLYVSHGIFSNGFEALRKFGKIITTNSIVGDRPDHIHVVDVVSLILQRVKDLRP